MVQRRTSNNEIRVMVERKNIIVATLNMELRMCEYSKIEKIILPNGKTVRQVNNEVHHEVERIYLEGWSKGISIPFRDKQGRLRLANPDGSEDFVVFHRNDRSYSVLSRAAEPGRGKFAYLLNN